MSMKQENMQVRVHIPAQDIADPAPLGLASFALTAFVLSAHNAGWAPDVMWVVMALLTGGLGLFAAGMWEFKKNNTFGTTVFTVYGGFWLSLGLFVVFNLTGVLPASLHLFDALGWYMVSYAIFNTYVMLCSLMAPKIVFLTLFIMEITFICLITGSFKEEAANVTWTKAGGYFGVATACCAFYASFAGVFNSMAGRIVIPIGCPMLRFPALTSSAVGHTGNDDELKGEV
eukprot:jgi/Mesen1/1803/ME000140S00753